MLYYDNIMKQNKSYSRKTLECKFFGKFKVVTILYMHRIRSTGYEMLICLFIAL